MRRLLSNMVLSKSRRQSVKARPSPPAGSVRFLIRWRPTTNSNRDEPGPGRERLRRTAPPMECDEAGPDADEWMRDDVPDS